MQKVWLHNGFAQTTKVNEHVDSDLHNHPCVQHHGQGYSFTSGGGERG